MADPTIDTGVRRGASAAGKLRGVEAVDVVTAERLLELDAEMVGEEEPDEA